MIQTGVASRQLGLSGVRVSEIGLGGNTFGRTVDERGTAAIVDKAFELGVNFIDTAESYSNGMSEELLGKALTGRRHEVVIATKTGALGEPLGRLSRKQMLARLDGSLKRLQTDYVDLFYMHFPDPGTSLEESLRALDDMVRAGKVLYPGLSNHPAWQVAEALAICHRYGWTPPIVTQNQYNLLDRAAQLELIPACRHFGLSLVPHTPLAGGFLTGKYRSGIEPPPGVRGHQNSNFQKRWLQDDYFLELRRYEKFAKKREHTTGELAIAWLLADPAICSVIAGVRSPEQVEANVSAARWKLGLDDLQELQDGVSPA